jgi:DNA-binding PadR family transcriptional regulator
LLILGVLRFKQPAHGYSIRRELETWRAEQWANIAYGSIYHALGKMAEEGLIEAVDTEQAGKRPARTTYRITSDGEEEFQRLLREYWWELKPLIDPFQVALTFMNELPRDELLAAMRHRQTRVQAFLAGFSFAIKSWNEYVPRHIEENLRLISARYAAEVPWAEEMIGKVERGELP